MTTEQRSADPVAEYFEGLLGLARFEANAQFERMYQPHLRQVFEPERKAMVVRRFLERICPIKVEEAL